MTMRERLRNVGVYFGLWDGTDGPPPRPATRRERAITAAFAGLAWGALTWAWDDGSSALTIIPRAAAFGLVLYGTGAWFARRDADDDAPDDTR